MNKSVTAAVQFIALNRVKGEGKGRSRDELVVRIANDTLTLPIRVLNSIDLRDTANASATLRRNVDKSHRNRDAII